MKTIVFSKDALRQLDEWKATSPKISIKIVALITEISETLSQVAVNLNHSNIV